MTYIAIDKSYIENGIVELKEQITKDRNNNHGYLESFQAGQLSTLKHLLSQGIEIPVEESWRKLDEEFLRDIKDIGFDEYYNNNYPSGVIIKQ